MLTTLRYLFISFFSDFSGFEIVCVPVERGLGIIDMCDGMS